jgi:hypothetical protein
LRNLWLKLYLDLKTVMVDELTKLGPFQLGGDVSSKLYRKTFSATPLQRRCDERRNAMAHTSPSRRIRR